MGVRLGLWLAAWLRSNVADGTLLLWDGQVSALNHSERVRETQARMHSRMHARTHTHARTQAHEGTHTHTHAHLTIDVAGFQSRVS